MNNSTGPLIALLARNVQLMQEPADVRLELPGGSGVVAAHRGVLGRVSHFFATKFAPEGTWAGASSAAIQLDNTLNLDPVALCRALVWCYNPAASSPVIPGAKRVGGGGEQPPALLRARMRCHPTALGETLQLYLAAHQLGIPTLKEAILGDWRREKRCLVFDDWQVLDLGALAVMTAVLPREDPVWAEIERGGREVFKKPVEFTREMSALRPETSV
ncbi:hypothetical protein B0T26DRAFT_726053 [Lasiosphaeria miniovina]|uniref:BTB domain-containing protein n=1 Tax=Lasiosphaeria miniovina TaxID=1954250 RepID=A0AA39ZZ27_9PEZI|nr:uncharacterized protein B0T26DRAFT_726053 [Lasiosphaeria miniovina]KAK0706268.1 hypothetical protein B0T26DRAFT_726053 [Lasiosphaeria miniovina]